MHEYPQMVSLRIQGQHQCGGTLINKNTVLTAAHCVWDIRKWTRQYLEYYKVQVVLGEFDLHRLYGYEKFFQVTSMVLHNTYNDEYAYVNGNDVALLKFNGAISNSQYDYIKYGLLDTTSMSRPGQRCEVVGWGSLIPAGVGSSQFLQKAYINVIFFTSHDMMIEFNFRFCPMLTVPEYFRVSDTSTAIFVQEVEDSRLPLAEVIPEDRCFVRMHIIDMSKLELLAMVKCLAVNQTCRQFIPEFLILPVGFPGIHNSLKIRSDA